MSHAGHKLWLSAEAMRRTRDQDEYLEHANSTFGPKGLEFLQKIGTPPNFAEGLNNERIRALAKEHGMTTSETYSRGQLQTPEQKQHPGS